MLFSKTRVKCFGSVQIKPGTWTHMISVASRIWWKGAKGALQMKKGAPTPSPPKKKKENSSHSVLQNTQMQTEHMQTHLHMC